MTSTPPPSDGNRHGSHSEFLTSHSKHTQSLADRLEKLLSIYAAKMSQDLEVLNRDRSLTIFKLGQDRVRLHTRLSDHTVGTKDGTLVTMVEQWEVQRFPWWKKALEQSEASYGLLPPALNQLARDAGMEKEAELFIPDRVISQFNLVPEGASASTTLAAKNWAGKQIQEVMQKLLADRYVVKRGQWRVRVSPLTPGAEDSLRSLNGEAYNTLLELVRLGAAELRKKFEQQSEVT